MVFLKIPFQTYPALIVGRFRDWPFIHITMWAHYIPEKNLFNLVLLQQIHISLCSTLSVLLTTTEVYADVAGWLSWPFLQCSCWERRERINWHMALEIFLSLKKVQAKMSKSDAFHEVKTSTHPFNLIFLLSLIFLRSIFDWWGFP